MAFPTIAADTTILQSASSYIEPANGRVAPKSDQTFDSLTTAFCNGANLILPLPKNTQPESPFLLHNVWWTSSQPVDQIDNELSDNGFSEVWANIENVFAQFVEGDPYNVVQWIAFQFTDTILGMYLNDSDKQAIEMASPLAGRLLDNDGMPRFRSEILKLQKKEKFSEPRDLSSLVGSSSIPSLPHLCLSYAIGVCLRGWLYAAALSELDEPPIYKHAWIRQPALQCDVDPSIIRKKETETPSWFPWGKILTVIYDPKKPLASRIPWKVIEALEVIREKMKDVKPSDLLSEFPKQGSSPAKLTEAEKFVLDILRKVGAPPRYTDTSRSEKLAKALRTLVSSAVPVLKAPAELITGQLQNRWIRKAEVRLRLRFRRDRFWEVFSDPAVRESVRKYSSWQFREPT